MKRLIILFILSWTHHSSHANELLEIDQQRNENLQPVNQYLAKKHINNFRPIIKNQNNGDQLQFNPNDHSNEIHKGSYNSNYHTIPTVSSLPPPSTHLKQISPSSSPALNYSPMLHINQPTPVIMQYMPGNIPGTSIQYLQLIPTRPLIVPISPFIATNTDSFSPIIPSTLPSPTQSTPPSSLPPHFQTTSSVAPFLSSSTPAFRPVQPSVRPFSRGIPLMPPAPSTLHPTPIYKHPQILANPSPRSLAGTALSQPAPTTTSLLSFLSPNYQFDRPHDGLSAINLQDQFNLNTNEYMPNYGNNALDSSRQTGQ